MRKAWKVLFSKGKHKKGLKEIRSLMGLCPQAELKGTEDVEQFAQWLQDSFDYLAMVPYFLPQLLTITPLCVGVSLALVSLAIDAPNAYQICR